MSADPARIGEYEILARLKDGGMATLYLARKTGAAGFSRQVVIKIMRPELASDSAFVDMFLHEARLCSHIHHPNVVHVEELGERDGLYYLVMEYVHGTSLSQFLSELAARGRRMTLALAGHVAIKIAEGLHAAHESVDASGAPLGVVHRDVSPQNVLVSYGGHVKLIDFGVAHATTRGGHERRVTGKLAYMAPEQAYARPIDRRADVYALGVMLWEMLTMQRLFTARTDALLLDKVRHPKVPRPSAMEPTIPAALEDVIMSALEADPDRRPGTTLELSQVIAAALPDAAAYQPSQVSEVVRAVMDSELQRARTSLPTLDAPATVPDTGHVLSTNTVDARQTATWFAADLTGTPSTLDTPAPELRTEAVSDDPIPRRAGARILLVALAVLAIGGGGVGTVMVMQGDQPVVERSEPSAQPPVVDRLPPAAEPEPEPEPEAQVPDAGLLAATPEDTPPTALTASEQRSRARRARDRRRRAAAMGAMEPAMQNRIDGVTIVSDFD